MSVIMSEKADSSAKPNRLNTRWRFTLVGILVVVSAVVIWRGRMTEDAALERALAGTWTAVDPNDAALHRRELPVTQEQLDIRADGTLTHVVALASEPGSPNNDLWGWKVRKGRLYVRFLGEDGSGQSLPGFAFTVSDTMLSIRLKERPPKEFVRR